MTKEQLKNKIIEAAKDQRDVPYINDGALVTILDAIVDAIPSTSPLAVHEFDGPFEDYKDEYNVDDSFFEKLRNAKEIDIEVKVSETVKTITFSRTCVIVTGNDVDMLYGFSSSEFDAEETCDVQINFSAKYLSIVRKSR